MIIIGVDFHPEFQQIASVDRHRRVSGKTATTSRRGGEVQPRSGGSESAMVARPPDYFPGPGAAAIRFEAGRVLTSVPRPTDRLKTVPLLASPPALVVP